MGMIILGIIILVLSLIVLFASGVCIGEKDNDAGIFFILATIFLFLGFVIYSVGITTTYQGYASSRSELPVHGVCEVLYTSPTTPSSVTGVLIKLPDGQLRLFQLSERPEIGLVKVQSDYSLKPFTLVSVIPPEIESTETVIP